MAESVQAQIEKVRTSITSLEAQRSVLGDAVVNTALAALQQQLDGLEQQAASDVAPVEERRMVSILFIDMVGSTAMAEKMDPEEWRQIVSRLHTSLADIITTHHGSVAQYLGDGLLAFFGSKVASEHDPENAIRAALDAHTTATGMELPEKLQLRAGIHTGLVVVGELGDVSHREFTASGDAMNLAARLQSAAPPGGTLISHDTYRYVRGVFDLTPRPPLNVKGKSEPLHTYLVRRAKPRPFRSVARGVAGVETRTVGRESEMHALQSAYLRAFEGHGMVWAQLLGDPGVGKSRLLMDLSDWLDLRDENYRLLRARAFPDDANQPYALVRRMWFDRFQIAEDAPLEQAEAKWVERFKEFSGVKDFEEPAHALGLLVGLPFEDSPHIKGMRTDPTQVKGRALVVSRELLNIVRQHNPVVVLLEDLQWTDSASWDYLVEVFLNDDAHMQPCGLYILGAARPEWQPPAELVSLIQPSSSSGDEESWGTQVTVPTLSTESTRQLIRELLQRTVDVPDSVIDLLVERSEGIPYYAEEIINWFIDHDILDIHTEHWRFIPDKLKAQPLPATLQHLLLTRLGTLSQPEQAALQRGAIFGRRFWTGGVEALGIPSGEDTLALLQPRGFVEAQPESAFQGDTEWSFHHNLLQEVTYESVLKRERADLHKVAASWLERQARQAGRLDEFAGLLGDHFERAGELSTAADWYLQAGRRAFAQGAPREAVSFYSQALDLLPPVDRERRWQALLGREEAYFVLSDAGPWYDDITALLELAYQFDDDDYLAEAYLRQAKYGLSAGDIAIIDQASQESLAAARRSGNEALEAQALIITAMASVGRRDKSTALERVSEALHLARRLGDDNDLAVVLFRAAWCYGELGDFSPGQSLLIEQIELNRRLGRRGHEAGGLGNLASTYITVGRLKQARVVLEQAIQINSALGARRNLAYNLMNLGELFRMTGDHRKSLQLNEQALQDISHTPDARGTAFVLTNLGNVLVAMSDFASAARRFNEARELTMTKGLRAQTAEVTAGLALCCLMQGEPDLARTYVIEAWDYIKEQGWTGMGNPTMAHYLCAQVFDGLDDEESCRLVLERVYKDMVQVAETFDAADMRQSFFENIPENRAITEMWERSQQ